MYCSLDIVAPVHCLYSSTNDACGEFLTVAVALPLVLLTIRWAVCSLAYKSNKKKYPALLLQIFIYWKGLKEAFGYWLLLPYIWVPMPLRIFWDVLGKFVFTSWAKKYNQSVLNSLEEMINLRLKSIKWFSRYFIVKFEYRLIDGLRTSSDNKIGRDLSKWVRFPLF